MLIAIGILLILAIIGAYSYVGITDIIPSAYVHFAEVGVIIILGILCSWVATLVINRIFDRLFSRVMKGNELARKIFPLLCNVIIIFVWLIGLFFVLTLLKINISALLTGAGVSGVMIAFAGKDYAANLIGSANLIFSKSFKIGDVIRVKGFEGTVDEITLTTTRLIDKTGATIFMPNKNIVSETLENLSHKHFEILELNVEVALANEKQTPEGVIDSIENEIVRLGKKYEIITSSVQVDKISTSAVNITVRIKTEPKTDLAAIRSAIYASVRKTKM